MTHRPYLKKGTISFRIIATAIAVCLLVACGPRKTNTQQLVAYSLPSPTKILSLSRWQSYPVLKGIRIDPKKPLNLEFIIDTADQDDLSKEEASRLIRYFLAGLTLPDEELWVNLSPYEEERVVPDSLALTDLGKDMLGQDYVLKQLLSSLTYPEDKLGKEYWKELYREVVRIAGTTNIPINTFNKVWIMPDKAKVYENGNVAFVTRATLKCMLEEDYLALKNSSQTITDTSDNKEEISKVASRIMKEIVLPKIQEDVSYGKNFATLRQIYHSLILGVWFKQKFKDSFYKYYIDQGKIKGIDLEDKGAKDKIYNLYVEAYKKGVYDYIRRDYDTASREYIDRRYYSGGVRMSLLAPEVEVEQELPSGVSSPAGLFDGGIKSVKVDQEFVLSQKDSNWLGAIEADLHRQPELDGASAQDIRLLAGRIYLAQQNLYGTDRPEAERGRPRPISFEGLNIAEFENISNETLGLMGMGGVGEDEGDRALISAEDAVVRKVSHNYGGETYYDEQDRILRVIAPDGRVLVERSYETTEDNEYAIETVYSYAADNRLTQRINRKRQTVAGVHRQLAGMVIPERREKLLSAPGKDKKKDAQKKKKLAGIKRTLWLYGELVNSGVSGVANSLKENLIKKVEGLFSLIEGDSPEVAKKVAALLENSSADKAGFIRPLYLKAGVFSGEAGALTELKDYAARSDDPVAEYMLRSAQYLLGENKQAIGPLLNLVNTGEGYVPDLVAAMLAANDTSEFSEQLILFCQDATNNVGPLLTVLGQVDDPRAKRIIAGYVDSNDSFTKIIALKVIGDSRMSSEKEKVRKILQSRTQENNDVIEAAIKAAARLGDQEAAPFVHDLLKSHNSSILGAIEAVTALAKLGTKGMVDDVIDLLGRYVLDLSLSQAALEGLASLGAVQALPRLRELFSHLIEKLKQQAGFFSEDLLRAIAALGGYSVMRELFDSLPDIFHEGKLPYDSDDGFYFSREFPEMYLKLEVVEAFSELAEQEAVEFLDQVARENPNSFISARAEQVARIIQFNIAYNRSREANTSVDEFENQLLPFLVGMGVSENINLPDSYKYNEAVGPEGLAERDRKLLDSRPDFKERLFAIILEDSSKQLLAMRFLTHFPELIHDLLAKASGRKILRVQKLLLTAILEEHINAIITNYTERSLKPTIAEELSHDSIKAVFGIVDERTTGTEEILITLKEKEVEMPEVNSVFLSNELLSFGVVMDENEISRVVEQMPYFRFSGGVILPKLGIINSSYRGSREDESDEARFSTRAITVAMRYRGSERGQSSGGPALYEWDTGLLSSFKGLGIAKTDFAVAHAFFFANPPGEHVRKRKVALIGKSDFETARIIMRQQQEEHRLKQSLLKMVREFTAAKNSQVARGILGSISDRQDATIFGILYLLKSKTGLLPAYVNNLYGSFETTASRISFQLEQGKVKPAGKLLTDCSVIKFLQAEQRAVRRTIEDPNISLADTKYDEASYETVQNYPSSFLSDTAASSSSASTIPSPQKSADQLPPTDNDNNNKGSKPHFGDSGVDVDKKFVEAQREVELANAMRSVGADTVDRHLLAAVKYVEEAMRMLEEDEDAEITIGFVEVALWVLEQLDTEGYLSNDSETKAVLERLKTGEPVMGKKTAPSSDSLGGVDFNLDQLNIETQGKGMASSIGTFFKDNIEGLTFTIVTIKDISASELSRLIPADRK